VRPDRVAVIGWSQGGGAVLLAIGAQSPDRPAQLPQGDFGAAVAFYPTSCNTQFKGVSWTSAIPLLVLVGDSDVLHPVLPCKSFLDGAAARGAAIEMQIYPGAYHHFDWPDVPRYEVPSLRNAVGAVPIYGTDLAARQKCLLPGPGLSRKVSAELSGELRRFTGSPAAAGKHTDEVAPVQRCGPNVAFGSN
jgi:dienelactone hydrolase